MHIVLAFISVFFQKISFACDYNQIERFIVLRHAHGTHLIDNKLNSLNQDEKNHAQGATISEADLTLGGVRDQLKAVAENLKNQGIRSDNLCVISSDNVRAVQTATVVHDYLEHQGDLYDKWRSVGVPVKEGRVLEGEELNKLKETSTQSDLRIMTRLTTEELTSLRARMNLKQSLIPTDHRLREASFGPAFEGKRYETFRDSDEVILKEIRPDSPTRGMFEIAFVKGKKKKLKDRDGKDLEKYEGDVSPIEDKVQTRVLNYNVDSSLTGEERKHAIERNTFLASELKKAKVRIRSHQRVTLATALGAESKTQIFDRVKDFLKNSNGLRAGIESCCHKISVGKKLNILFSTHDSTGGQLISFLKDGHDQYRSEAYKLKPAEAVSIPMNADILRRLEWNSPAPSNSDANDCSPDGTPVRNKSSLIDVDRNIRNLDVTAPQNK